MHAHTAIAAQPTRVPHGHQAAVMAMPRVAPSRPAAGFAANDADPLAAIAQFRVFDREQSIFAEGEAADAVFRVVDGMIRLYKLLPDGRRQIIGFLQAGDMVGLAFADRYLYSAEAITASTVQRIPRCQLDALLDSQPALARRLLSVTTSELVAAQDQMLLLGRKSALEKLASFLLALSRRAGAGRAIALPMSRCDIADHLGLTTETVSRGFTKLKTSRLIRILDGGRVELLDAEALAELAECA
ncbi:Transcriptional regulator, Crp/Fnr family [Azospirillum argentinense]|uniref:Helix-turn-helix domain-containing protein n=1 Tax=Azospirillum formosense TaxID=861533 RepID=A0ABX2KTM9_9PROT|nr:helix-turn-helix domain-containing protein [Azospirillum formosense]MBY3755928.1 helix-turn-helix domain-containing protein [Azospirillum formosense]NUB20006.1 helix-turn-helix domain-containing protein [Azospirillum formosense]